MDLSTTYLGLKLANPLMPGASPLTANLGLIRRLEDAGAAAIVLPSLFEEQFSPVGGKADGDEVSPSFLMRPQEYCEHLSKAKAAVGIPVCGSLNGSTYGGWLRHAIEIEQAGADAIELNIYSVATPFETSALGAEMEAIEMTLQLKRTLRIPVAVKLSPYYTSFAHFCQQLDMIGAEGLVLFNRFYQPDINPSKKAMEAKIALSTPGELLLRLRWLASLSGRLQCSLAASGGVHDAVGAVKALMAGADAVQVVSALLIHGPERLKGLLIDIKNWMEENGYESVSQLQGAVNLEWCADPGARERANYIRVLQAWGKS